MVYWLIGAAISTFLGVNILWIATDKMEPTILNANLVIWPVIGFCLLAATCIIKALTL